MGYLPKGLSAFLRGSPGLRAFLDMEPLSNKDSDQQRSDGESLIHPSKKDHGERGSQPESTLDA